MVRRRVEVLRALGAACCLLAASSVWVSAQQSAPQPAAPAEAAPPRPAVIDAKAQQLLDKSIQALGGPAFLNFKTLTTRGRGFVIERETTVGMLPFESWVQYPDKRRFSYGKDKPVILINNGDQAWELDRYGGIRQPLEQARHWQVANRYSLENVLRLLIHEPGVLVQYGGVDFVDNLPSQVIEITDSRHVHVKLYLSRKGGLPVRISYSVQNLKTLDWDEFSDSYGDYQLFQGVQTPMHISRFVDDERAAETFRHSATYNETYPADYFQPPNP